MRADDREDRLGESLRPGEPSSPSSMEPAGLTVRQRELFVALLDDFLREGFADFTIDRAVKRYRCSKSTLYALGSTVDDIIRRTLVSFFREIARRTEASLSGQRTSRAALEAYFCSMAAALEPASPAFMRDLATCPVAAEIYETNSRIATDRITRLIARGIEDGELEEMSPDFLAVMIEGAMQRIQQGQVSEILPAGEAYRELGRLVLHGVVRRDRR